MSEYELEQEVWFAYMGQSPQKVTVLGVSVCKSRTGTKSDYKSFLEIRYRIQPKDEKADWFYAKMIFPTEETCRKGNEL